jgi:hypothetical protein
MIARPLLLLPFFVLTNARIFYTDLETEQSVPLEVNRDRLTQFQRQILSVLGLQQPPFSIGIADEFASRYMSTLYRTVSQMEDETFNPSFKYLEREPENVRFDFNRIEPESRASDTIISFVPKKIYMDEERFAPGLNELHFDLSVDMDAIRLISAELYFIAEKGLTPIKSVNIYTKGMSDLIPIGRTVSSPFSNSTLVSMNITGIVAQWLDDPSIRRKLYADLRDVKDRSYTNDDMRRIHIFGVGFFVAHAPEILLHRTRRSIPNTPASAEAVKAPTSKPFNYKTNLFERPLTFTGRRCRLRNFYVAFSDLGWESWVIAPMGYQADYCSGDCSFPLDSSVSPTNHAIVQTLVHVLDEKRASPAKCAPTSMKSQSILFFDNQQNVVMKRYQHMRVKQCGCQ